jgi:hypothetical protein
VAVQKNSSNLLLNIRIGKHTFKFLDESAEPADKTTKLRKIWIPGVYYTERGRCIAIHEAVGLLPSISFLSRSASSYPLPSR